MVVGDTEYVVDCLILLIIDMGHADNGSRPCGGTRILAIGRHEVLGLYRKVGLRLLGREVAAGAVRFELMTGIVRELSERLAANARYMRIVGRWLDRRLQG